jgi:hypothetical protein
VISLVLKLVPDILKWQLDLVLSGMVREFHGGTGTAWVPMGHALSKVLQGVKNEGDVCRWSTWSVWRICVVGEENSH